ncbi:MULTISPECIES: CysB family HTH-type transcriptional regulator [unclassified Methylophaga]|uniref:CysB family HTH-type transcriptional regulator n=1 Tax=unclassified Methylophaga TaxID=2629249 RepID=UPI000C8F173C|nr:MULTISPECIES: CysB family HTH-type transcriptional regulator [unclassified Methylophaga]MAK65686.1 transcriptional regulator [Methylophaga sp.]MAY16410.1 transcriptional regulator [Methylophaga sp.]HCD05353.1 transcriptional regulator [Methylophaga sp.]
MNFQQLRIIRETVRRNFNLTEVANHLFTSQSGVSKHIKDLEDELGVELYIRKGKRLTGLTEPGKEMLKIVERMLLDANNIKRLAEHYSQQDTGKLTIATTHTQARYVLPEVITQFKQRYPKVHLKLHQGSPDEIVKMMIEGEADIGIATEALGNIPELVSFAYYHWQHAVIVPKEHPLIKQQKLTLADIAEYPIVTYHEGFTGRATIDKAFLKQHIDADIAMSALDADVIKSYVELGLGVGIVAAMAYDAERDIKLTLLDSSHLFEQNITKIAVRKGHYMRQFAYDFIQLCVPDLPEEAMVAAITQ